MLSILLSILSMLSAYFIFFGYISSNDLFPEPLSQDEELEYINKYISGDKEAKNILIERNLRLVAHIAKKYSNGQVENEEYISIGTIGLIKAINSYNLEKKVKLSTYAARCIENEILMSMRLNKKTQSEISINSIIGTDKDGNDMALMDIINSEDKDIVEDIDTKFKVEILNKNINKVLKEKEKKIIIMRYGLDGKDCMTQQEIANVLGISRSYVSRIETRALIKLKVKNIE